MFDRVDGRSGYPIIFKINILYSDTTALATSTLEDTTAHATSMR